jgi:hypothetical protein
MYHGYIYNGQTHDTYGAVVDENVFDAENLPTFLDFTLIFQEGTVMQGKTLRKIWNADLMYYDDGTIAAILTSRINNNTNGNDYAIDPDHAFIYCRYDGLTWSSTYLGQAGKKCMVLKRIIRAWARCIPTTRVRFIFPPQSIPGMKRIGVFVKFSGV